MSKFWKRNLDWRDVEAELRAARPEPRPEFVAALATRVREDRVRGRGSFRLAFAGTLTAGMLVALAAFGGLGYAASSVGHAVDAVAHLVTPAKSHGAIVVSSLSSGGDQYRPSYGYGDKNHVHTGPPGMHRPGGQFAPPLRAKTVGGTSFVTTSFSIDEQAHLTISVLNGKTKAKISLTQNKSKVGKGVKGPSTKNLQYLVLVPRTIPLKLAIPSRLLVPGQRYFIRVIAKSPTGAINRLLIPFTT